MTDKVVLLNDLSVFNKHLYFRVAEWNPSTKKLRLTFKPREYGVAFEHKRGLLRGVMGIWVGGNIFEGVRTWRVGITDGAEHSQPNWVAMEIELRGAIVEDASKLVLYGVPLRWFLDDGTFVEVDPDPAPSAN